MKKSSWICFFSLVIVKCSFGQMGFEYRQKVGFLAAHHAGMAHMPNELAVASECSYVRKLAGEKTWHQAFRQPLVGGTFFYGSVGNNAIFGRFIGTYGFVELPIIKLKKYRMDWKFGTGVGYSNHPYDAVTNPKNSAIGSHFNAIMCFALKQTINVTKVSALTFSLDMTHFSNGAFKVPNLGINVPYCSFGYQRFLTSHVNQSANQPLPSFLTYHSWQGSVNMMLSKKETMPIGGKKYPVFGASLSLRNYFSPRAGMEINLDVISKQALMNYEPMVQKSQWDILQLGISASYLLPLDRFNFVYGAGVYIRDLYRAEGPLYIRLGCRYYLTHKMSAFFGLKTHYAKADYLEFGLTYHFNKKQ